MRPYEFADPNCVLIALLLKVFKRWRATDSLARMPLIVTPTDTFLEPEHGLQ